MFFAILFTLLAFVGFYVMLVLCLAGSAGIVAAFPKSLFSMVFGLLLWNLLCLGFQAFVVYLAVRSWMGWA